MKVLFTRIRGALRRANTPVAYARHTAKITFHETQASILRVALANALNRSVPAAKAKSHAADICGLSEDVLFHENEAAAWRAGKEKWDALNAWADAGCVGKSPL